MDGRLVLNIVALDRPLYDLVEAASLLSMPRSTLRSWLEGQGDAAPVLRPEPLGSTDVTWGEFVEARLLRAYRDRDVPMQRIRPVVEQLRTEFGVPYPLAHFRPFVGAGRQLLFEAEQLGEVPQDARLALQLMDGQFVLSAPAAQFVAEAEFSDDEDRVVHRVRPDGSRSPVVIDPRLAFGAPNLQGIRTEVLAELVAAGELIDDVAADFDLTPPQVRAAVAYEWRRAA